MQFSLGRMYHSSFGIRTHLLELFVKCLVLKREFARVRFTLIGILIKQRCRPRDQGRPCLLVWQKLNSLCMWRNRRG
jgi:hypothetical protein